MSSEAEKLSILVNAFNQLFLESENTCLRSGADEPFYQAATDQHPAVIYSREQYFSSALHEIAHWCIAGKQRRMADDFGYWYRPEGRSQAEQMEFERVEIRPQAIEWIFSLACDHPFHFSADNLSQGMQASQSFQQTVTRQMISFLDEGNMPSRAKLLFKKMKHLFRQNQRVEIPNV